MGVSTDAHLWFGVIFEDDYTFPWFKEDESYGDIEDWWRKENGFQDSIHDEHGNWINGVRPSQAQYDEYFAARREFDAQHPLPVEEINYCSGEYPMYGLAVSGTIRTASRGNPRLIEGIGISPQEVQPLKDFLAKYDLQPEGEAGWYLTSYWG